MLGMMVRPAFVNPKHGEQTKRTCHQQVELKLKLLDEGEVYTWFNPSILFHPSFLLP